MLKELKNTVVHCKSEDEYNRLMKIYEDGGWVWTGGNMPTQFDGWEGDNGFWHYYECKDEFCRGSQAGAGQRAISLDQFLTAQGIGEDLKAGDWVEVIEKFECWPMTLKPGMRLEVTDWMLSDHRDRHVGFSIEPFAEYKQYAGGQKDSQGRRSLALWEKDWSKLCKCPPPEEKVDDRTVGLGYRVIQQMHYDLTPIPFFTGSVPSESYVSISIPTPPMSIVDSYRNSVLSADERVLRKAGLKDSCGKLTCEGEKLLLAVLADEFKTELVKEAKRFLKAKKGEDDSDDE